MQLRVHEDTGGASQCEVRFHFLFPLIKTMPRQKLKSFSWDINSAPVQRLWLSKDTSRMMEVINDFIGTVYKRVDIDDTGEEIQDEENQLEDVG